MIFEAATYEADKELYERLGLRSFVGKSSHEWRDLGTVEHERAGVQVEVCAMPAQFYRFTITSKNEDDAQSVVLRTGSGRLGDFWPTVELWSQGMFWAEGVTNGA